MRTDCHMDSMFAFTKIILLSLSIGAVQSCTTNEGEYGVCKSSFDCVDSTRLKNTSGIEPTLCGRFVNAVVGGFVVCCTDINKYLNLNTSVEYTPGMKIHERKCLEYTAIKRKSKGIQSEMDSSINSCFDGTCFFEHHIIGGSDAGTHEFPHIVRIGWKKNNLIDWKCAGSIISEKFVLTAAHCTYSDDPDLEDFEPTIIRLMGFFNDNVNISTIIAHPDYNPPHKYNDIALIQLAKPIRLSWVIRPACLSNKPNLEGNGIVIGWGHTSSGGGPSTKLQKVTLDVYDDHSCKQGYRMSRTLKKGIAETQFCAGYRLGGKDACQGDSGGPMLVIDEADADIFEITGITSFGAGCGSTRGGVYTRVSKYIDWIEKNVWPDETPL